MNDTTTLSAPQAQQTAARTRETPIYAELATEWLGSGRTLPRTAPAERTEDAESGNPKPADPAR